MPHQSHPRLSCYEIDASSFSSLSSSSPSCLDRPVDFSRPRAQRANEPSRPSTFRLFRPASSDPSWRSSPGFSVVVRPLDFRSTSCDSDVFGRGAARSLNSWKRLMPLMRRWLGCWGCLGIFPPFLLVEPHESAESEKVQKGPPRNARGQAVSSADLVPMKPTLKGPEAPLRLCGAPPNLVTGWLPTGREWHHQSPGVPPGDRCHRRDPRKGPEGSEEARSETSQDGWSGSGRVHVESC